MSSISSSFRSLNSEKNAQKQILGKQNIEKVAFFQQKISELEKLIQKQEKYIEKQEKENTQARQTSSQVETIQKQQFQSKQEKNSFFQALGSIFSTFYSSCGIKNQHFLNQFKQNNPENMSFQSILSLIQALVDQFCFQVEQNEQYVQKNTQQNQAIFSKQQQIDSILQDIADIESKFSTFFSKYHFLEQQNEQLSSTIALIQQNNQYSTYKLKENDQSQVESYKYEIQRLQKEGIFIQEMLQKLIELFPSEDVRQLVSSVVENTLIIYKLEKDIQFTEHILQREELELKELVSSCSKEQIEETQLQTKMRQLRKNIEHHRYNHEKYSQEIIQIKNLVDSLFPQLQRATLIQKHRLQSVKEEEKFRENSINFYESNTNKSKQYLGKENSIWEGNSRLYPNQLLQKHLLLEKNIQETRIVKNPFLNNKTEEHDEFNDLYLENSYQNDKNHFQENSETIFNKRDIRNVQNPLIQKYEDSILENSLIK